MKRARKTEKTAAAPSPEPVRREVPPPNWPGSMERVCRNCQHYDGVKLAERKVAREGRCHNGISRRIMTTEDGSCTHGFYPCVVRFPLKAGTGGARD